MGVVTAIVDKLKLKELFGIVFIAAIILTILPTEAAVKMRILEFRESYQPYISLCIIAIGAYYILHIGIFISNIILGQLINSKKSAIKYMKTYMSPDEMGLLVQTFYNRRNGRFCSSGKIDYSDGRKAPLESKNIIYLASTMGNLVEGFSYNLQPYVLDFLNDNLDKGNIHIGETGIQYKLL